MRRLPRDYSWLDIARRYDPAIADDELREWVLGCMLYADEEFHTAESIGVEVVNDYTTVAEISEVLAELAELGYVERVRHTTGVYRSARPTHADEERAQRRRRARV